MPHAAKREQPPLKYGSSTGRIIGSPNRFVLLNLIETNSDRPTYLAYDAAQSTSIALVYYAIVEMGRGSLSRSARDRFKQKDRGDLLPWLIEERGGDYVVLDWTPFSTNRPGQLIKEGGVVLLSTLGKGAFGTVYLAHDCRSTSSTPEFVAVKHMKVAHHSARQYRFQQRELELHALVSDHPNVVTLRRIVRDDKTIFVVMDYLPEGDMFYHILEDGTYLGKTDLIKHVFGQIVDAVKYLHVNGVYHRDIKPENILTSHEGTRIYLADFGLATDEEFSYDYGCGSILYLCPESLREPMMNWHEKEKLASAPLDIWSLGVLLVNLVTGRSPWKSAAPDDLTYQAYLRNPENLRGSFPLSMEFFDLLTRIFSRYPKARIGIDELRTGVDAIRSFTMTKQELELASGFAREVAVEIGLLKGGMEEEKVDEEERNPSLVSGCSSSATLVGPITPEMGAEASAVVHDEDIPDLLQTMGNPVLVDLLHAKEKKKVDGRGLEVPRSAVSV